MAAIIGRVAGVLSGITLAQNQGFGMAGTVACAAGGFVLGKILDCALEGCVVQNALDGMKDKAMEKMDK